MNICHAMLRKDFDELKRSYGNKHISKSLGQVIAGFVKDERLLKKISEQEVCTMCTMIDELMMESEQKGIKEGFNLGSMEKNKEIIHNMMRKHFSINMIKDIVGLSEKEITALIKEETTDIS